MAGPWEQYTSTPSEPDGPWSKFQEIKASQRNREQIQAQIAADPISQGARSFPTEGNMVMPGVGSVVDKYATGVSQMAPVGAPTTPAAFNTATPEQIGGAQAAAAQDAQANDAAERERRAVNIPLDRTAGGRIGKFSGEVAVLAPTTIAPGAASVRGSTLIGGGMGAVQPVTSDESRILNTVTGGVVAGGGSAGINAIARALSGRLASQEAAAASLQQQNSSRDAIISQAREAGYVLPPASVNPSFINTTLESLGGKVGTERKASLMNQKVTNQLVREELGIPPNVPISQQTLRNLRKKAGEEYEALAGISPEAQEMVKALRQERFEANRQQKYYERSANPEAQDKALTARANAERIEGELERIASQAGNPDLVQRMVLARQLIAKTHNVEKALTKSGNVDASALGKADYLSGRLRQVADLEDQFPKATQLPENFGSTNVSAGKAFASALMGGGGAAAMGPAGWLAAAAPFVAPPAARSVMFSDMVQNAATRQNYGPSGTLLLANALASNPQLQRLAPSLAIPYVPQVQQ